VVAGHTKRFQLGMRAWELGAGTDANDDSPFGNAVEGGQRVRKRERVPEQRQQNRGAERDASRGACDAGQEGDGLSAWTRQQRVTGPHRVEPGFFRQSSRFDQKGQVTVCPQQGLARRQQKPGCV
jgi:hypothetical protein